MTHADLLITEKTRLMRLTLCSSVILVELIDKGKQLKQSILRTESNVVLHA